MSDNFKILAENIIKPILENKKLSLLLFSLVFGLGYSGHVLVHAENNSPNKKADNNSRPIIEPVVVGTDPQQECANLIQKALKSHVRKFHE